MSLDAVTGLYNYGARYYDPGLSIWMGVDPLADKFNSWSPYHYATNNPINIIDYDGRDTLGIHKGKLNTELSDDLTNVWNVTFSITKDGVTTPVELEEGSQVYMFGNKKYDKGVNGLNGDNPYTLVFQDMATAGDEYQNTINVEGTQIFIHPGNSELAFKGCKALCEEYTKKGDVAWGVTVESFHGWKTQSTLNKVNALYNKHESRLSGNKFLLYPNSSIMTIGDRKKQIINKVTPNLRDLLLGDGN